MSSCFFFANNKAIPNNRCRCSYHTVCIVQRNFTHLIRCQTMKVKPYIILNTRKHVNYEEDKIKYPWTSLATSKIRIFAMVFSIFHFLKHLINEGETTQGERDSGRNDPDSRLGKAHATGNQPLIFQLLLHSYVILRWLVIGDCINYTKCIFIYI